MKINNRYMFGILCESDEGLDAFGNPIGKPILLELVGDQMQQSNAIDRAQAMKESGQFGYVKLVSIEVCEYQF